jgi:hypothetical protein
MFLKHFVKYRVLLTLVLLPVLTFSTWIKSTDPGGIEIVNEIIFTEPLLNTNGGLIFPGEKKQLSKTLVLTHSLNGNVNVEITIYSSYKRSFSRVSFSSVKHSPFLTSHFATDT